VYKNRIRLTEFFRDFDKVRGTLRAALPWSISTIW